MACEFLNYISTNVLFKKKKTKKKSIKYQSYMRPTKHIFYIPLSVASFFSHVSCEIQKYYSVV